MPILGVSIFLSIILSIVWTVCILDKILLKINRLFNIKFYDENKHPIEDWDALGDRWGAILLNILSLIPGYLIFLIDYFVFNRAEFLLVIVFIFVVLIIPLSIMELRSNVFTHNKKQILSNGVVKSVVFTGEGYPINIVGLASMFNMWCCVLFGLGNYFQNYHTRFLVLAFICLLFELMFLFIDYVDKVIPLNLKSSSGFFTYAIIILFLAFTLSLRFYSWTSWV